ncbi:MAG: N-acetylneuraminate synthase family protein [Candidatus Omnitrophota bacterium]
MKKIKVADKFIGEGCPAFIVAEAGCNHEGSLELAKKLVDGALKARADAIKFQHYDPKKLVTKTVPFFWVDKKGGTSQLKKYKQEKSLTKDEFRQIAGYCRKKGIIFFSTPFDYENADFLEELDIPLYKLAATDLTNIPFLKYVAKKGRPVAFSAGMCSIGEIEEAIEAMKSSGNDRLIPLHCIVAYPASAKIANLNFIRSLQKLFPDYPIGFSDHTLGINIPAIAASLGAKLIEKHYTVDKTLTGTSDHAISVDAQDLKQMVKNIREAEVCLGSYIRTLLPEEKGAYLYGRRKVVASRNILKGTVLKKDMITCKRSGDGLYPKFFDMLIGRKANVDIKEEEGITWDKIS